MHLYAYKVGNAVQLIFLILFLYISDYTGRLHYATLHLQIGLTLSERIVSHEQQLFRFHSTFSGNMMQTLCVFRNSPLLFILPWFNRQVYKLGAISTSQLRYIMGTVLSKRNFEQIPQFWVFLWMDNTTYFCFPLQRHFEIVLVNPKSTHLPKQTKLRYNQPVIFGSILIDVKSIIYTEN